MPNMICPVQGLIYPVLRPSTARYLLQSVFICGFAEACFHPDDAHTHVCCRSAKDAALSRQNSASSACNRAHLLKRSESLKFPPSRAGARGGGGGERGGKDLESKLVLQRDRPSSARPGELFSSVNFARGMQCPALTRRGAVPGSMRTLKRSSSLRPTSTSKRGDGEGTALARSCPPGTRPVNASLSADHIRNSRRRRGETQDQPWDRGSLGVNEH